jgi:hypothetical protein
MYKSFCSYTSNKNPMSTFYIKTVISKKRVLVGKPDGKNHLEGPGVDGRMILRWIFRKWDVGAWIGLVWLRIGTGDGLL